MIRTIEVTVGDKHQIDIVAALLGRLAYLRDAVKNCFGLLSRVAIDVPQFGDFKAAHERDSHRCRITVLCVKEHVDSTALPRIDIIRVVDIKLRPLENERIVGRHQGAIPKSVRVAPDQTNAYRVTHRKLPTPGTGLAGPLDRRGADLRRTGAAAHIVALLEDKFEGATFY